MKKVLKILKYILYYFIIAVVLVPISEAMKIPDDTASFVIVLLPIVLLVAVPRLWKLAFRIAPKKQKTENPYLKRLAIALLVYAVTFVIVINIVARITTEVSNGFLAVAIIVCVFGVPGLAAFFTLYLYEKKKPEAPPEEEQIAVKQTPTIALVANPEPLKPPAAATPKPEPTVTAPCSPQKPPDEKPPVESHDSQFIRLRQYREKLQEYSETLKKRDNKLKMRSAELEAKKADLDKYETNLKNEENRILSTAKAIRTEEQMERYEQQLHSLEHRVFSWVRQRENDEIAAFEELRKKVEVYLKAQDALQEEMSGLEFEQYFSGLLVKNGYTNVKVTKKTGDFGADVIADLGSVKYAFQCKYYSSPVGVDAVYQVNAAKTIYGAHVAVAATNSVFTKPAQIAAENLKVILWDGGTLSQLAAEKS